MTTPCKTGWPSWLSIVVCLTLPSTKIGENASGSSDADSLERLFLEELEPRDDARPTDLPREEDVEVSLEPAAASADEPAGTHTLAACLAATEVLRDGNFRRDVVPWQRFAIFGRVTTWPLTAPYEQLKRGGHMVYTWLLHHASPNVDPHTRTC